VVVLASRLEEKWWFRAFLALLGIGAIVLITLWASSRKRRESERQRQFNEMQLQAIRSKSLPHFSGNAFSNIDYFIETGDRENASKYLALLSRLYSITLKDSDRPARSLREEIDYLSLYIQMEMLRFEDRIHFEWRIAPDVSLDMQVPTMVLHTFVENAVKHGVSPKPEGGNVLIIINRTLGGADLIVEDDGIGRDMSARSGKDSTKQGLAILQRQVDLYNRANVNHLRMTVEDLFAQDNSAAGTRYHLYIPDNFNYR
jgi:sensor histidine kinase YesM